LPSACLFSSFILLVTSPPYWRKKNEQVINMTKPVHHCLVCLLLNPLPVQFKSLLRGQEGCIFSVGI
jgi:hypothetical protein